MEVILKEDVVNLGKIGEVVRVRDGYARNYLLPRGLVQIANKRNLKTFEHQRKSSTIKSKKSCATRRPSEINYRRFRW